MAFNWQTFQTRALSAVVFVVIMAVGLLWNEWSFLVLFSIIHFGCWIEYYKLIRAIKPVDENAGRLLASLLVVLGWGVMLYVAGTPQGTPSAFEILKDVSRGISGTVLIILLFALIYFRKKLNKHLLISLTAGLLYISLPLGLLCALRMQENETNIPYFALTIPLLIIANNWINDTMAYIVGSLIGKTPFSPISPKKTWEGTIGGVVLAVITITLIAYFSGLLPLHHAAALSFIGAVTGTFGDLFESKLKRMAGVKDSGTMMPGHGGFLDRFDSLLFSATACAVYVALAMN
jgi:phosphatidate cytidylyltransferase